MLLRGGLVNGSTWELGIATLDESCLPQEILQQIAVILSQKQNLGLLNDVPKVSDKVSTFWRELAGWVRQRS